MISGSPSFAAPCALNAAISAFLSWFALASLLPPGANAQEPLKLEPIYRLKTQPGRLPLAMRERLKVLNIQESDTEGIAFRAVISEDWLPGFVPIFAVEKDGSAFLRRAPLAGQESFSEPLFFAVPLEDEPAARRIAGRWTCISTNARGDKHYFGWDLTLDGERVIGRFGQHTEYRVALLARGTFRSNRIDLIVEYINDRYAMQGIWHDRKLTGTWQLVDGEDHGWWEGSLVENRSSALDSANLAPLYEWRAADGKARRYSTDTALGESGWERTPRPLCQVWRP